MVAPGSSATWSSVAAQLGRAELGVEREPELGAESEGGADLRRQCLAQLGRVLVLVDGPAVEVPRAASLAVQRGRAVRAVQQAAAVRRHDDRAPGAHREHGRPHDRHQDRRAQRGEESGAHRRCASVDQGQRERRHAEERESLAAGERSGDQHRAERDPRAGADRGRGDDVDEEQEGRHQGEVQHLRHRARPMPPRPAGWRR